MSNTDPGAEFPDLPKRMDAVFRDATQNLVFAKSQQVTVTNYALIGYGATATLVSLREKQDLPWALDHPTALISLIVLMLIFNVYFLISLETMIGKYRERLAWIYKSYFTADEVRLLALPTSSERSQDIAWALGILSTVGAGIAVAFVCDAYCR